MDKKEYLQTAVEQIRCIKARDAVKEELAHHIEDQTEAFMMDGMNEEEASMQAVKEMGDPVEAGVALDLVHRPKMEWKMVAFVIGLSVLGFVLQQVIAISIGTEDIEWSLMQFKFLIVGISIMFAFCFFDYSRIGLYDKIGAIFLISFLLLTDMFFGHSLNGQSGYITFRSFKMHQLLFFYIPFFGGILYSYKGQGRKCFYKSIAWMIPPCVVALSFGNITLTIGLLIIMMIQFGVVMKNGWIQVSKNVLRVTTGAAVIMLAACIGYFGYVSRQPAEGYLLQMTRGVIKQSVWMGQGAEEQIGNTLFNVDANYIITYVMSSYGILPAILSVGILGLLIFWIVKISVSQKNQLGMIMGLGCSLVLALQIVSYLLVNLSVLPLTTVCLPFIYCGGTGTLVSFALIGILLSVYRYQNVLPSSPCKKRETVLRQVVMLAEKR